MGWINATRYTFPEEKCKLAQVYSIGISGMTCESTDRNYEDNILNLAIVHR